MLSTLTNSVSSLANSLVDWETQDGGYPGEYDAAAHDAKAVAMAKDLENVDRAFHADPQRSVPIELSSFRSASFLSDVAIECRSSSFHHSWPGAGAEVH